MTERSQAGIRTTPLPLDPRPWLERFEEMVAALRADPRIEVDEYEVNPPATDEEFATADAYSKVPDEVRAFYKEANGLTLRWELKDNEDLIGSIRLLKIQEVFSSWEGNIWFDEEWDNGEFKPLHPVDFFVDEACAVLELDGSDRVSVGYHYCGEEFDTMAVDFTGYLELLLKTRGFWYWQTAIAVDVSGGPEYTVEPGQFRRMAAKLFDDYDESFLFNKDYSTGDQAKSNERQSRIDGLLSHLDKHQVHYELNDTGSSYINIDIIASTENLERTETALKEFGVDFGMDGDWGAKSVGDIMIHKV